MIEPIIYMAIGFLLSALLGLMLLPLVHNRAVRLTTRRLQASAPVSMTEVQADKDQLRAEFALSARKLEMTVDQLKGKATSQAAELGKKAEAVNRLKVELSGRNAEILALQAREQSLTNLLRSATEDLTATTASLHATQQTLSERQAEAVRLNTQLTEQSQTAENRQVELTSVHQQIDLLKQRVDEAEREFAATQQRLDQQRIETTTMTSELAEARGHVESLSRRVGDLDGQLIAQVREAETLGKEADALRERVATQAAMLTERDEEAARLRQAREEAETAVKQLRDEVFALSSNRSSPALSALQAEHTAATAKLQALREERDAFQREQADNALLREKINDIAAEVARLTMRLEGPESPINAILAAEPAHSVANGGPAMALQQTLADRIRALQAQTTRHPG
jgi:chromosome segregation ATPase